MTDVAIVGAGIAGLTAALKLSAYDVTVICNTTLGSGAATAWAQGGIAAAVGPDDSPELHSADTKRAGAGLSNDAIVNILTKDAPAHIEALLELGTKFDRTPVGDLALGREAAHNRRRIVKAGGDATGHEILKTLVHAVREASHIRVMENTDAEELLLHDGRVAGVLVHDGASALVPILASATILATGGIGHIYARTTNPPQANGDGVAMAARAGAVLADMEFMQFHPTAIDVGKDPMPLATEALRGEGATLIDERGFRFMPVIHPDAELAPRDVVARAIFAQLRTGHRVYLDARRIDDLEARFPTVFAACIASKVDPRKAPIPVAPAAHYHMGGISVDAWGQSSLQGLWACGEASATGMHGANRLASNSLLEALAYGTRVAQNIESQWENLSTPIDPSVFAPQFVQAGEREARAVEKLRGLMYAHAGLVREGPGMEYALREIETLEAEFPAASTRLRNMLTVSQLLLRSALARRESRGSHYRSDFPKSDAAFAKRSFTTLGAA